MVRSSKGRYFYDKILNSQEICLYCGFRDSTTLDHYLSKSVYPNYAILPINLVPCCDNCNRAKSNYDDNNLEEYEYFLHPYFDDYNNIRWLNGTLEFFENSIMVKYYIDNSHLNEKEQKRIAFMDLKLGLCDSYTKKGTRKFQNYKKVYLNLYRQGGKAELISTFKSLYQNLNAKDINDLEKTYYMILEKCVDILEIYFNSKI